MRHLPLNLVRCMHLVVAVTCSHSSSIWVILLMELRMCQLGRIAPNSKNIQCLESLEYTYLVFSRLIHHQGFRKHLKALLILEAITLLTASRRAICLVVLKDSLSQVSQTTKIITLSWTFQRMETPSCTRAWRALTLEVLVENSVHKNSWSNQPLLMSLEVAIHKLWDLLLPSSCPTILMKWHAILSTLLKSDRWSWLIDNIDRAWDNQVVEVVFNSLRLPLINQLMLMGYSRWY